VTILNDRQIPAEEELLPGFSVAVARSDRTGPSYREVGLDIDKSA
jgi:hypothetical protein